jgi:cyclopropane fatty-acyl-phospholipid synthase-like methyltransferase
MRVLEIGCGWGGFAEHASQQGIAVHGITISHAQLDFARQRLAGKPLVQLEWQDYRDLHGQYDAIVSIEMFEAVGEAYWPGFFANCASCSNRAARHWCKASPLPKAVLNIAAAVTLFRPSFSWRHAAQPACVPAAG